MWMSSEKHLNKNQKLMCWAHTHTPTPTPTHTHTHIHTYIKMQYAFTCSFTPFLRPVKVFRSGLASVECDELCGFSCLQGDTEEMSVDRTIHLRSGAEATAVTVGTKGASASFRTPVFWERACKCDYHIWSKSKLHFNTTYINHLFVLTIT